MLYETPRKFIDACGGYRKVAVRFGMQHTTLHTHMASGVLPAKLYRASCQLASECGQTPPEMSLFSFIDLQPEKPRAEEKRAA